QRAAHFRTGDAVDEIDLAALFAVREVHGEPELIVVNHHRILSRNSARENLVAGVRQDVGREVDDRRDVVEHASAQVAVQLDDLRALLRQSGGRDDLRMHERRVEIVDSTPADVNDAFSAGRGACGSEYECDGKNWNDSNN